MINSGKMILLVMVIFWATFFTAAASANMAAGVQVTDVPTAGGVISGKLDRDLSDVDLYVVMVSPGSVIHSLTDTAKFTWTRGVAKLRTYDFLSAGGWESMGPVDLSMAMAAPSETVFHLILVSRGADPRDPQNRLEHVTTGLIHDPSMRVPGQVDFASSDQGGGYRDLAPDVPTTVDDNSDGKEDGVEKPDIYKVLGDTVYYANTRAGRFQVIDLSDPAAPLLTASRLLAHTPVELFLADGVICLIEERQGEDLALRLFRHEGDTLAETGSLVIPGGSYEVSKRKDNLVYLVARGIGAYPGNEVFVPFEPGEPVIYAVDISNPSAPALLAQKVLKGYDPEIYMDRDNLIFLSKESWEKSLLEVFDLGVPGAPLSVSTSLEIPGRVPSEFHMDMAGDFLRVVYRNRDIEEGSALGIYDLGDRSAPRKAGLISGIAPGEELFATRFSGDRAYVVTFERTDPLWVLDLSDPEKPVVLGELEVPGWSEYMTFFDDKLLAVGYDDTGDGRLISTALFLVKDPARPSLLDRVTPFAGEVAYSYSDAVSDERAFYFNLETGLVLFPLRYYDKSEVSGVAMISLNGDRDRFAENGFLSCSFNVLRGFETGVPNIAASLGDGAMNTIDVTSISAPRERGYLRLAEQVAAVAGRDDLGRIWSVGGDTYYGGEGEVYVYDADDLSFPSMTIGARMKTPRLVADGNLGVLFTGEAGAMRGISLETGTPGPEINAGNGSYIAFNAPFMSKGLFYFGNYLHREIPKPEPPVEEPEPGDPLEDPPGEPTPGDPDEKPDPDGPSDGEASRRISGRSDPEDGLVPPPEEPPGMEWRLHRYDFTDPMLPAGLKDISIPGRPLGMTDDGRIVCVEESTCYYCETEDRTWGIRLNLVSIVGDLAFLDKTVFVETAEYAWPVVVMEETRVYVVTSSGDHSEVRVLDTGDLGVSGIFELQGHLFPVEAGEGRVLFTVQGWYPHPYMDFAADSMIAPGYGSSYIVYDLNGSTPVNLLEGSDIWLSQENVIMVNGGLYVGNGYRGIRFISY